ncbi:MAG TPA: EAL domain-containing protein [Baekduia sp.]|nr:EAL domain-containing protein [Baekduia sp.]
MSAVADWAVQRLGVFLAAVAEPEDRDAAARVGVEHAAEALDAECVAVVCSGRVLASIGWPRFEVPERALARAVAEERPVVPVPGAGLTPAAIAGIGDEDCHLVVARVGAPLDRDELALLRGMARGLRLTLRLLQTVAAERGLRARSERQATENARLLTSLRRRQQVLEAMASIQRSISRREPLSSVLSAVVAAAGDLLSGEAAALLLLDPEEPGTLVVADARGFRDNARFLQRRQRVDEGVTGRAIAEDRLVVLEDYRRASGGLSDIAADGVTAVMAAPVHEDGEPVGALVVDSYRAGRIYTRDEQELLASFAQHVSLALTDARRVDAMLHQALHDALTGLPNRALFTDRLRHALTAARRRGTTCGVVVLDLDRFKTVNDSLGHAAGDELLIAVAQRLAGALRAADTAARLGGDEFAVLLEDLGGVEEAVLVAERAMEALRAPIPIRGREVLVTAAAGIAVSSAGASELLRQADVAMYRAKARGKGRHAVFEDDMQAEVLERLELESELQRAIDDGDIDVHYQPIVALDGHTLAGFEALARWSHPTRGPVPPPQFIPLAEENGAIVALGRHVLRAACRQAAAWLEALPAGEPLMTVNLSGRQLEDAGLVRDVADALADSRLPASSLVLEITETVLMQDTEATIDRLRELKELGVRLAVDDFGTGYSSLRYLRRFPIDILKMAKPFVDGLHVDDEGRALARTIVELATSLRLACIAEGIEAPAQADVLHDLGCGLGQGYHFARPMAADALTQLLGDDDERRFRLPSTPIL